MTEECAPQVELHGNRCRDRLQVPSPLALSASQLCRRPVNVRPKVSRVLRCWRTGIVLVERRHRLGASVGAGI